MLYVPEFISLNDLTRVDSIGLRFFYVWWPWYATHNRHPIQCLLNEFIACFLIQAPLNNTINSVSFTEFVDILTTGPFLVLTLANIKGLTIKRKIS